MVATIQTRVFIPKLLDPKIILEELQAQLEVETEYIESQYKLMFRSWNTPAQVTKTYSSTGGQMKSVTGTDDNRALWADEGTRARIITPRADNPRGLLFFREGYHAATVPNIVGSRAAYRFGPLRVTPAVTKYEGIKPRNFTKVIAKQAEPRFHRNMQKAAIRGATKTVKSMFQGQRTN